MRIKLIPNFRRLKRGRLGSVMGIERGRESMSLFTWAILYFIHTMMSNVYDNTLIFWGVERHFFAFISWGGNSNSIT